MIKTKELMYIGLTIFLTVVSWVVLEIRTISTSTPTESQIEAIDINYSIDTRVLDELSKRTN